MEEFLTFLRDYWQVMLYIILFLVALIFALIKGKKQGLSISDIILGFILDQVPAWINSAEDGHATGPEKRARVLDAALQFASKQLGRDLTEQESSYIVSHVSVKIEEILSTPQKKEAQKKSRYR